MPAAKRLMDIVLGTLLALVALPVVIVLALAVLVTLRTWPFFTQQRVGRGGRLVSIIKLRTLPPAAPRYASKYQLGGHAAPRLCEALRRLHLDELPQLLLVVSGVLSLVGPRPEMPFLAEQMDGRFAAMRTAVRPGCTGVWQVSPAADLLIGESPEYDLWYVEWANLRVDCWTLWRTALLMLRLGRPVGLGDVPAWTTWRPRWIAAGMDEQWLAPIVGEISPLDGREPLLDADGLSR
jgi:lipopolysaccharide/colanic/teichoic acid biosynthesis glycosyltransferase